MSGQFSVAVYSKATFQLYNGNKSRTGLHLAWLSKNGNKSQMMRMHDLWLLSKDNVLM